MSDLLAPLLVVLEDEVIAIWCFTSLIKQSVDTRSAANYIASHFSSQELSQASSRHRRTFEKITLTWSQVRSERGRRCEPYPTKISIPSANWRRHLEYTSPQKSKDSGDWTRTESGQSSRQARCIIPYFCKKNCHERPFGDYQGEILDPWKDNGHWRKSSCRNQQICLYHILWPWSGS